MRLQISVLALAGAAQARIPCRKVCIDSISDCGVRYGGCFNPCKDPVPQPPPCFITTILPTPLPSTTSTLPLTPTPPPSYPPYPDVDCASRIVCIDAVNECGVMYGGCFPDCKPYPLVDPGCDPVPVTPVPLPSPTPV